MADQPKDAYPSIYVSTTDPDLPEWFTNDFPKYANFQDAGSGGGGVLNVCYDNNLCRSVIVKRLPNSQTADPRQRRRLLREARVTAQLQHPNTVPVYEIGKDENGNLYFSMKKIEGENFFKILGRIAQLEPETTQAFPLSRLLGIIIQASNALGYAHAHGVIHRDVKPENIMVGLFNEVTLMDWGVAKVWGLPDEFEEDDSDYVFERLTKTGQRPGTPLYMSPEQVNNNSIVDERTDIFSMGVVMYEMLALREPFRGHNIKETFKNINELTPPPPSKISKYFTAPSELDDIIYKAIAKDPVVRYQSIQGMIDDIRNVRNQGLLGESG